MRLSIGDLLLKESLITSHQLLEALDHQARHGGSLSRAFVTLGFVKDRDIASLLSVHCCVPTIDIEDFEVSSAVAGILPAETARKYQALPLARLGATLAIAVADPTNAGAFDDIRLLTGLNLEPFVAAESALEEAIERCYGESLPAKPLGETSARGVGEAARDRPLRPRAELDGLVDILVEQLAATAGKPPDTKAPSKARITLGELLMEQGLVSLEQCLEALRDQKRNGGDLGAALVRLGFVKDEEILAVLSVAYGIPSIRLDHFDVHPAVLEILAPETARKHQVLPLAVTWTLTLAVADPANQLAIDTVRSLTGWTEAPQPPETRGAQS